MQQRNAESNALNDGLEHVTNALSEASTDQGRHMKMTAALHAVDLTSRCT